MDYGQKTRREIDPLIDVRRCWEVFRIAANVDSVLRLVYPDVVDSHVCGKWDMVKIHRPKVPRHAKVRDEILAIIVNM